MFNSAKLTMGIWTDTFYQYHQNPPSEYSFNSGKPLLKAKFYTGLIREKLRWKFGRAHLYLLWDNLRGFGKAGGFSSFVFLFVLLEVKPPNFIGSLTSSVAFSVAGGKTSVNSANLVNFTMGI